MAYRDLYEFAQGLNIEVSRNALRDRAIEITGVGRVAHVRSGMDISITRGFWLTPQNVDHTLVQQLGCHIIGTARALNRCWERLVYVKELMHLFDQDERKTSDRSQFGSLLGEFAGQAQIERSQQMTSEVFALWRALALLCPEARRQQFSRDRADLKISDYDVALQLRIPEQFVPLLFDVEFDETLPVILEG